MLIILPDGREVWGQPTIFSLPSFLPSPPPAPLQPSHKLSGEHLGSQKHETNAVLAMHSFNETPDGGWSLHMALQSCWRDCNTWANSEGSSLSLQGVPCPPVCSPHTLGLLLVPPELEAGARWCLSPQLLCALRASEPPPSTTHPKYVPDKILAVPTFKPCHLKVVVPQKRCPWQGCSPPLFRRVEISEKLSSDNRQCLLEVLPAFWRVTSFAKPLSHSCPVILLNTNVPVICHRVLPFCCSRGSPDC